MNIPTIPSFKRSPLLIISPPACLIAKSIINQIMNKNHLFIWIYLPDFSTRISTLLRDYILGSCVCDNFLCCCVCLDWAVAISICHTSCMILSLIMIALGIECKLSFLISDFVVLGAKIQSMLYVSEIREKWVFAGSKQQIKEIAANTYSNESSNRHIQYPRCITSD